MRSIPLDSVPSFCVAKTLTVRNLLTNQVVNALVKSWHIDQQTESNQVVSALGDGLTSLEDHVHTFTLPYIKSISVY